MIVLGIMSGSSLDGIDLALCQISESGYEILQTADYSIPLTLEKTLRQSDQWSFRNFLVVERDYTNFIAHCIQDFGHVAELVSVHGHTTYHIPEEGITHQLINGGKLSAQIKMPVACDFRMGDMSLGGVGTPLVPILEKKLMPGYDYYLNLGGIANLTINARDVAFDVCPCNQLLNKLAAKEGMKFDDRGALANEGKMIADFYDQLSAFDYYFEPPPKSLDNNWIKEKYHPLIENTVHSTADLLFTTSHWICDRIAEQLGDDPTKMMVTGGGAHNEFLVLLLQTKLLQCQVVLPERTLIDYKEAILMCLMGYLRYHNKVNILSSITGAQHDNIGGALYNVHGAG